MVPSDGEGCGADNENLKASSVGFDIKLMISNILMIIPSPAMAPHRALTFPELRICIASQITDKADLANFSQTDKLSEKYATPILYRHIDVLLKRVPLIVRTLRSRPEMAPHCVTLCVTSPPDYIALLEEGEEENQSFWENGRQLGFLLETLSLHGRLKSFVWVRESGWLDDSSNRAPVAVWIAVEHNARSLQALDLTFHLYDMEDWSAFSSENYTQLQKLKISLPRSKGWNCKRLHTMMESLTGLTDLGLEFCHNDAPQNFALTFTYPKLRTFALKSISLAQRTSKGENASSKDFLKRHTLLEFLDLETEMNFDVDNGDLPNLRVLSIGSITVEHIPKLFPTMANRPLALLRLVQDSPYDDPRRCFDLCSAVRMSLRFLCFHSANIVDFRAGLSEYCEEISQLDNLIELRFTFDSRLLGIPAKLISDDLPNTLEAFSRRFPPMLKAIGFRDMIGDKWNANTSPSLPLVPQSLRHLAWDVQGYKFSYDFERLEDKTVTVYTGVREGFSHIWNEDTILNHNPNGAPLYQ